MLRKIAVYAVHWLVNLYKENSKIVRIENYKRQVTVGKNFCFRGGKNLRIYNLASSKCIVIGDNVNLECKINCNRKGNIFIGENTSIRENSIINCDNNIFIGPNCFIGNGVLIQDNDSHPEPITIRKFQSQNLIYSAVDTYESINQPIKIFDGVWIGTNATILKGVVIGKGSIIGAGSVVTHDVKAGHIAAGNPARTIRKIQN